MNLGRVMGVILSVLVISFIINSEIDNKNNQTNNIEVEGSIAKVVDNNISYDTVLLSDKNNSNVEVIKYTNTQPYSIDLAASDVTINCHSSSSKDAALVKENMIVKAYFSRINDSKKTNSIRINPKETVNIYVVNEYVGDYYPEYEVLCDYNIDIKNV